MPSAIPRRLAALLGRSRASVLQVLLRKRWRLFQVHAAGVDRRRAGRRTGVLHEEDGPAGRGVHFMLEMRVGHIGYRAGAVELSRKTEFPSMMYQICAKSCRCSGKDAPGAYLRNPALGSVGRSGRG